MPATGRDSLQHRHQPWHQRQRYPQVAAALPRSIASGDREKANSLPSRAGEHARNFLQGWKGKLVCDDFGGYKASFELGVTEIGCMAHARRKFFELHTTDKSQLAEQALRYIQLLYEIESAVRDLEPDLRCRIRQEKAVPMMDMLHAWMIAQRDLVPEGSAISRALDYSLKRWAALSRYLDDGAVPIDNNWAENQIRPWALGRKNWLFAGSLRSGKRAAAIMSLIQSARLNGHDPYAYLKDVLTRLPTQRTSEIDQLLPHRWIPAGRHIYHELTKIDTSPEF